MRKVLTILIFILLLGCAAAVKAFDSDVITFKTARRGDEVFAISAERTFYFNNDTKKLCYMFQLSGEWEPARQTAALRTADQKRVVGVLFYPAKSFDGFEGQDLITRFASAITRDHEKDFRRSLKATLTPFEGGRHEAMIWKIVERVDVDGKQGEIPPKIIGHFPPGWVMVVTIGSPENEVLILARQVLESLSTTDRPDCYWPLIREQLPTVPR